MNSFEKTFFKKYIPEGHEIMGVIHQHWVCIIDRLLILILLFTAIPSFLYLESDRFQEIVPFIAFEGYLFLVFCKIIYDIFDWYNDVWIITNEGVVDLDWSLFKSNMKTVNYENIEGVEVEKKGFVDTVLKKGDIIINRIGDDSFRLHNAFVPYAAINEIERISKEMQEEDDESDKFEMMMEALSGVVEDYLQRNGMTRKDIEKKKESIEKVEGKENTIDLR